MYEERTQLVSVPRLSCGCVLSKPIAPNYHLFFLKVHYTNRPAIADPIDGHDIGTLGEWPETAHEATPCVS